MEEVCFTTDSGLSLMIDSQVLGERLEFEVVRAGPSYPIRYWPGQEAVYRCNPQNGRKVDKCQVVGERGGADKGGDSIRRNWLSSAKVLFAFPFQMSTERASSETCIVESIMIYNSSQYLRT